MVIDLPNGFEHSIVQTQAVGFWLRKCGYPSKGDWYVIVDTTI